VSDSAYTGGRVGAGDADATAGGADLYQAVRQLSEWAYRRSARWPIGFHCLAAYLRGMTTYTTPQFATGLPDRNVRPESGNRARPATAAPYRTAGVSNEAAAEAAAYADGPTPDWQPGVSKGVPKVAIGALGAALVGGVALAIVLMAPSNKVTKQGATAPVAQATTSATTTPKAGDATQAAVSQMDQQPPAAGANPAADATAAQQAAPAAVPAPVQAAIPAAPPVVNAPVARAPKHVATPKVVSPPAQSTPDTAPAATPDTAPAPMVTPPADVQPPAMQQTPDTTTVTPSMPAPAPTAPTPDVPAPAPAQ
jgi:hypothetical protein